MADKNSDKFVTMIGFAKRAGKIVYGLDNLQKARGVKLLAVGKTASDNLSGEMLYLAKKRGITLISADNMERLLGANIKALGITDENMAKAIVEYVGGGADGYNTVYELRR